MKRRIRLVLALALLLILGHSHIGVAPLQSDPAPAFTAAPDADCGFFRQPDTQRPIGMRDLSLAAALPVVLAGRSTDPATSPDVTTHAPGAGPTLQCLNTRLQI